VNRGSFACVQGSGSKLPEQRLPCYTRYSITSPKHESKFISDGSSLVQTGRHRPALRGGARNGLAVLTNQVRSRLRNLFGSSSLTPLVAMAARQNVGLPAFSHPCGFVEVCMQSWTRSPGRSHLGSGRRASGRPKPRTRDHEAHNLTNRPWNLSPQDYSRLETAGRLQTRPLGPSVSTPLERTAS
jgi:hypothetical protein